MKFIYLTALLTLSAVAAASSVDLGGTSVEVPAPANFVRVTPEMSKVFALQSEFVAPANDQLAFFIPQEGASAALADEIPDLPRRFSIQVAKKSDRTPQAKATSFNLKQCLKVTSRNLFLTRKAN